MKKSVRFLALVMALTAVALLFASCGSKPSGTYKDKSGALTMEFSGSKVSVKASLISVDGTFEMGTDKDGKETITFTFDDKDSVILNTVFSSLAKPVSFNQGKDNDGSYIEIGGVKYYKQ